MSHEQPYELLAALLIVQSLALTGALALVVSALRAARHVILAAAARDPLFDAAEDGAVTHEADARPPFQRALVERLRRQGAL